MRPPSASSLATVRPLHEGDASPSGEGEWFDMRVSGNHCVVDKHSAEKAVEPPAGSVDDLSDQARAAVLAALDYTGENRATEQMIVSALLRLPEDVRTFATERCRFVSVGDQPHADDATPSDRWLVELADGLDETSLAHVVATAVARAWLSHDGDQGGETDEEEAERELVTSWEFTGPGADA
jgi:hypothetical protein